MYKILFPMLFLFLAACQSPRISIVVDNGSTLTVGEVDIRAPKSIEATTDVDIPLVP